MPKKTFKFRIYPTALQETLLEKTLEECRFLYNTFLHERKESWEKHKKGLSFFTQKKTIVSLKKSRPSLDEVHSQVSQNVAERIDLAFKAFFRRCKAGEKPGYPRFRGKGQYHSFTYPQDNGAFKFVEDNRIKLSKIGNVKIVKHRELEGTPKTCIVSKTRTGKWFVCISCADVPENKLPINKIEVGIDLGLSSFATLSDGSKISNPRFFRSEENALAKAQRKKDRLAKGTLERRSAVKTVAKIHERIVNKRSDFLHKEANNLVKKYGIICVEDLTVNDMMVSGKRKHLSKSIADASWGLLLSQLQYKAENAGRVFVKVNPAYTSQDCSGCSTRQKIDLSVRQYSCKSCGLNIDRDLNAAKNVLTVGLHSLRASKEAS